MLKDDSFLFTNARPSHQTHLRWRIFKLNFSKFGVNHLFFKLKLFDIYISTVQNSVVRNFDFSSSSFFFFLCVLVKVQILTVDQYRQQWANEYDPYFQLSFYLVVMAHGSNSHALEFISRLQFGIGPRSNLA